MPTWLNSVLVGAMSATAVIALANIGSVGFAKFGAVAGRWMYDFQTLLGAIVAIVAAGIAVRPAYRQLNEMKRQSAAVSKAAVIETAKDLEAELNFIKSYNSSKMLLDRALELYDDSKSWHSTYLEADDVFGSAVENLRGLSNGLYSFSLRYPRVVDTAKTRVDCIILANDLLVKFGKLHRSIRQQTTGLSYESGETDLSCEEIKSARNDTTELMSSMSRMYNDHIRRVQLDIQIVWIAIRAIEREAIGLPPLKETFFK